MHSNKIVKFVLSYIKKDFLSYVVLDKFENVIRVYCSFKLKNILTIKKFILIKWVIKYVLNNNFLN